MEPGTVRGIPSPQNVRLLPDATTFSQRFCRNDRPAKILLVDAGRQGQSATVDASLKAFIDKGAAESPCLIAEVYALRKDPDPMFTWLDHAWANHDTRIQLLLNDAFTLRYRHDPRFVAFCRRVGLPVPNEQ